MSLYSPFKGHLYASLYLSQRKHQDETQKHWAAIVQASAENLWHPRSHLTFLLFSPHLPTTNLLVAPPFVHRDLRVRMGRIYSETSSLSTLCSSKQPCEHYTPQSCNQLPGTGRSAALSPVLPASSSLWTRQCSCMLLQRASFMTSWRAACILLLYAHLWELLRAVSPVIGGP